MERAIIPTSFPLPVWVNFVVKHDAKVLRINSVCFFEISIWV